MYMYTVKITNLCSFSYCPTPKTNPFFKQSISFFKSTIVWQRMNNGKYCKKRDRGVSQTCCATNLWWCEFLSHWAFMLITLCVNVRLTVFHFYQSYINFDFFDLLWWGWLLAFLLLYCLLLFCFLSPCDFTIFLVAGLIFTIVL